MKPHDCPFRACKNVAVKSAVKAKSPHATISPPILPCVHIAEDLWAPLKQLGHAEHIPVTNN